MALPGTALFGSPKNVNQQRGKGVFDRSIAALRKLNDAGFGVLVSGPRWAGGIGARVCSPASAPSIIIKLPHGLACSLASWPVLLVCVCGFPGCSAIEAPRCPPSNLQLPRPGCHTQPGVETLPAPPRSLFPLPHRPTPHRTAPHRAQGSGRHLDLVYNPNGAFLAPDQAELEAKYRSELNETFGIVFDSEPPAIRSLLAQSPHCRGCCDLGVPE